MLGSLLLTIPLDAADKLESRTTYAKAYGETKNAVTVDPAKELPRYPAVEPKDAVATWQVKKGFKLELAAHEPQVRDPIAISFDERGRMFVCEMIDYSEMRDVTPHLGRISMLEDRDGDGYYETSKVFADDLAWPTGVICANGGIFVIATPELLFFKDADGDGKADTREVVFTGFGTGLKILNVQGLANCPQWGLDNRIHLQCGGGNRGKVKCLRRPDLPEVEIGGRDFWFDPRTFEFGLEAGGAQYGMSFDNYGRKFACSNSDHLQFYVCDDRYAMRNLYSDFPAVRQSVAVDGGAAEVFRLSPDEPWRIIRTRWRVAGVVKGAVEGGGRVSGYFTGASGTTVYRGDAYGDEFVTNTFTGDAGGQLVHRKIIVPDGVSVKGMRPADEQGFEFAASRDTWVRVVNFANAPDGCLHVCDMYREVIEHPWSIPDEIKQHIDLNRGNDRGRIYRIVPESGPLSPVSGSSTAQGTVRTTFNRRPHVDLSKASTEELVKTLEHPNGWHRDCAARLLYEHNDKAAVPLLEKMVSDSPNALGRLHALCVLGGFNAVSEAVTIKALRDKNEHVRRHGILMSERFFRDALPSMQLANALADRSKDESQLVRLQLALSLSLWPDNRMFGDQTSRDPISAERIDALVKDQSTRMPWIAKHTIAVRDGGHPIVRAACLLGNPAALLPRDDVKLSGQPSKQFQEATIRASAAMNRFEINQRLIEYLAEYPDNGNMRAFAEGLKRANITLAKVDTTNKLAAVFLKAAGIANDGKAPEDSRLEALSLMSLATFEQAQPALRSCLDKSQPEIIQTAAVSALGQFHQPEVFQTLLERWPDLSSKARSAALAELLSRSDRVKLLLEAVQSSRIPATALSASQVQGLLRHQDKALAELAKVALASVIPPTRESVLVKFQPALAAKGEAARGQAVFLQRCMACHVAAGQGVPVGPDFVTVKTKGREALLTAILDPHKEVAVQYIAYTVNTKDGQTLAGIISKDDASGMTLRMMGGAEVNLPRSNIAGSSAAGLSLMPEGIESGMTVTDMADLLTFIEELK